THQNGDGGKSQQTSSSGQSTYLVDAGDGGDRRRGGREKKEKTEFRFGSARRKRSGRAVYIYIKIYKYKCIYIKGFEKKKKKRRKEEYILDKDRRKKGQRKGEKGAADIRLLSQKEPSPRAQALETEESEEETPAVRPLFSTGQATENREEALVFLFRVSFLLSPLAIISPIPARAYLIDISVCSRARRASGKHGLHYLPLEATDRNGGGGRETGRVRGGTSCHGLTPARETGRQKKGLGGRVSFSSSPLIDTCLSNREERGKTAFCFYPSGQWLAGGKGGKKP
ncbi:hypothetical protein TRV_05280, partial [Trichophyton verrucosum HKI 0517]